MFKRKTYTTRRLVIRPLTLRDYRNWLESDQKMGPPKTKYDPKPKPKEKTSYKQYKESILRQRRHEKTDVAYMWNIFLKSTGELVGFMDIATIERSLYQMANLGYCILTRQQGKGYGEEALRKIIHAGLYDLKFHRLEAAIDQDNRASLALAKKCGLHYEGIKRHYWYQNNRWEDQVIYIATPELWLR